MISSIIVDSVGGEPFVIETPDDDLQLVLSPSAQGPPGSQELRMFELNSSANTVVDYAKGSWQHLTLVGNVSSLEVVNWPAAGKAARLVLQITNTGAFDITGWPTGTKWAGGGSAPIITPGAGAEDLIVLSTGSGGSVVFGSVAGQDFS